MTLRLVEQAQRHKRALLTAGGVIVTYAMLGFLLAPWLLERNAVRIVRDRFDAGLTLADVRINPFVMSLEISGVEFDDPDGAPVLGIDRIFVNFQASSLFRRAWTFREFHVERPELFVRRDGGGALNLAFLAGTAGTAAEAESGSTDDGDDSGPPRLLIMDFAVRGSAFHWEDQVPPEPVVTSLGPIDIVIADLNTLPDRAGEQDVVITTDTQGTLTWSGSLALNPFLSEGRAAVRGSHFPLTSAYLKHESGIDIVDGEADVEFSYRAAIGRDGGFEAGIRDLRLRFSDIRVRTFKSAIGRDGEDRDLLELPLIRLEGGELRWPEQTAAATLLAIDGAALHLLRDAAGELDVLAPADASPVQVEPASPPPAVEADPWRLSLERLEMTGFALDLEDRMVTPAATVGWRSLDAEITDISNQAAASFPTSIRIAALDGGDVAVTGQVSVLPEVVLDLAVGVDALALAGAQPYLRPLADVSLDSGLMNAEIRLASGPDDLLSLAGDVEIADFLVTETDEGSRLGSWRSLALDQLRYSAAANTLEVSEVRLLEPYGDILIAEDGTVNLGRVQKGEQTTQSEDDGAETVAPADDAPTDGEPPAENGLAVTIGRVSIANASADFEDRSLPLPFSAEIRELNGSLTTIATGSSEPSSVDLKGRVDEFGQVLVTGTATPLDPPAKTDIRVIFENVDMPKFSAYSVPFAGREIASGRLDLDLGYKLTSGALEGENRIVLRDFELGEKVDHPGALSLPLGLAVALLKDPNGRIDLDVPVRGDVNDPEFRYGGVIVKALVNLLTRIVTSPFALLANLVGAEADELEYLAFQPGRAELAPPEMEKAAKIAAALAQRPQLALQIAGVFDPEADAAALRVLKLDGRVDAQMASAEGDDDAMFAERRQAVIETLYAASEMATDPAQSIEAIKAANTSEATDGSPATLDALAYTEALRQRLIEAEPVTEQELDGLARSRAEQVRQALIAANGAIAAQIVVEAAASTTAEDGIVRMQIRLTAGEDVRERSVDADGPVAALGSPR